MKKLSALLSFVVLAFAISALAQSRKIRMVKATRIASQRVHGRITSKELEKENGRWIYSFDIRTGKGKITEVAVDAYSGKIVSVTHETPANEAKEAKEEKVKH